MLTAKRKEFIVKILIVFIGFFIMFKPTTDPDFGWHYKYGEYLFNNHHLLRQNIFSYNFASYEWANSYWLFEFMLFTTYKFLGPIFAGIFYSVLGTAIITFIFYKIQAQNIFKIPGLILTFMVLSSFSITIRSFFFSTLFMFILLYVLTFRKNLIKLLPFMFLVWVNLHADFTLGLFILGLYTLSEFLPIIKSKMFNVKKVLILLIPSALSFLLTFINPDGYKLLTAILNETGLLKRAYVMEWQPIGSDSSIVYAFFIAIFVLTVLFLYYNARKTPIWILIPMATFFFFAMKSAYFIRPLFVISIFSTLAFWNLDFSIIQNLLSKKLLVKLEKAGILLSSFILFVALSVFTKNVVIASDVRLWSKEAEYPYEAISYIRNAKLAGSMFNTYGWGGYLIWQMPEHKTFIDGRMTSWRIGKRFITAEYLEITREPKKYEKLFDSYKISWVLDKPDSRLIKFLKTKKWKVLYEDKVSIILQNPIPPNL